MAGNTGKKLSRVQKIKAAAIKRRIQVSKITEYHLKGWCEKDIAWATNTPQKEVRNVISELKKSWTAKQVREGPTAKEKELERLEQLYRVAWDAWERSIGKKRRTITTFDEEGDQTVCKIEEWEEVGDARFLSELRALSESRRRLLGLDAPELHADATGLMMGREEMQKKVLEIVKLRSIGGPPGTGVVEAESKAVGDEHSNDRGMAAGSSEGGISDDARAANGDSDRSPYNGNGNHKNGQH